MAPAQEGSSAPQPAVMQPVINDDGDTCSIYSEKNPLPTSADFVYPPQESKIPKAVAKTGWSRTVAMDKGYVSPAAKVFLGAPGTGLSNAAVPANGVSLGPTLGHKAREQAMQSFSSLRSVGTTSWSSARVTADDLAAAAVLRKVRPPPDAASLPSPRPWSETDASSAPESPLSSARRQQEHRYNSSSLSSGSSDLGFIVGPAGSGSFFGTRPTKGRSVEKRTPSTVGETRLHDSLAKYFGHQKEDGDYVHEIEVADDSRGDKHAAHGNEMPCLCQPDEQPITHEGSTPATKVETRESSFEEVATVSTNDEVPTFICHDRMPELTAQRSSARELERIHSVNWRSCSPDTGDVDKKGEEMDIEKGREGKKLSVGEEIADSQARDVTCGCLNRRAWPFKVSNCIQYCFIVHLPNAPRHFGATFVSLIISWQVRAEMMCA